MRDYQYLIDHHKRRRANKDALFVDLTTVWGVKPAEASEIVNQVYEDD